MLLSSFFERPYSPRGCSFLLFGKVSDADARPCKVAWIYPRCPHVSMSAGVKMVSARASCCPRSEESVSFCVMAPSSDTLFLMLQNTHTKTMALGTYQTGTNTHILIILNKLAETETPASWLLRGDIMMVALWWLTVKYLFSSVVQVLLDYTSTWPVLVTLKVLWHFPYTEAGEVFLLLFPLI